MMIRRKRMRRSVSPHLQYDGDTEEDEENEEEEQHAADKEPMRSWSASSHVQPNICKGREGRRE